MGFGAHPLVRLGQALDAAAGVDPALRRESPLDGPRICKGEPVVCGVSNRARGKGTKRGGLVTLSSRLNEKGPALTR